MKPFTFASSLGNSLKLLSFVTGLSASVMAETLSHPIVLPTDNDALLRGEYDKFFMYVDRNFENKQTTPWEGGEYGFVRGPVRFGNRLLLMSFHEGIDIAPTKRDAKGEPLDEIRAIADGKVVYCLDFAGGSNYGKYIVVEHQWGEGPMYSLYAHLSKIDVKIGQSIQQNQRIGKMGYTGSGLDRRRSHLHLELNLLMSHRYEDWHRYFFGTSPNKHGIYNGLNLTGWNVSGFYLERQKNPALKVSEYILKQEVAWKVRVPKRGALELLARYPWLATGALEENAPSWEFSFADSGLPVQIATSSEILNAPKLLWVKNEGVPYTYGTKGMITGSGSEPVLSPRAIRHLELILGLEPHVVKASHR